MFSPVAPPKIIELKSTYSTSQYCLSGFRAQHGWDQLIPTYSEYCNNQDLFDGNIGDPELYTLSGWEYTAGADPASINPETQPLTKYLFGLSIRLFGTPLIFQWLVALVLLYLTYRVSLQLIPVILLAIDGLFHAQLIEPYLDLTQSLLALTYLSLVRRVRLSMVILGLLALSKSFAIGILMYLVTILYWLIVDRHQIITVFKNTYLAILTYFAGYTMFFVHGHSLLDFVQLHLNIIRLYRSYVPEYPRGEIFRIIISGEWRKWYDDFGLVKVTQWSLFWPIALLASMLTLTVKKLRANKGILLHLTWIIVYLSFISLRLVFPRYLLPILPSMYIVLASNLSKASNT